MSGLGVRIKNQLRWGKDDITGSIEVGKSADFIILDHNLFDISVRQIHQVKVLRTVFMGKTVYTEDTN
jgi:hypothetical protein